MGRLTGGDPSLLRRINSAVVLHALRATDFATLTEITGVTGLSRPTVEGVVEGLIEAGLVIETDGTEPGARRQGRPARKFRFRAEAGHLLGLEIGPHRVAAVLSALDGRIMGSAAKEISEAAPADERIERLRGTVADLLRRAGVARDSLRAVGVGSPGIVEADGTVRLGTALPGWTGLPLGERLRRSFKCPVIVENDANTAAVAEHWKGAGVDSDDLVMVLAGLSPGAGALIGGRLHRGFGGAAGEIGALHLLGREVRPETLLSTTDEPLHPLDEQAVAKVFALARRGDERAGAAVERFIQRLVHDVAALVLALDPELVIVGGWAAGLDGV
ncbi:ROK family protein, partial [Streptomyces sp. SID5785]|uniref:ROK family protein n=1 Tax=Streptomyces sp. SID5785 TaxID=2690309 RepID=UPI0013617A5D